MGSNLSIRSLVYQRLPFANDGRFDEAIEALKLEVFATLECYLSEKPDAEEEAYYPLREKSLIADVVGHQLLNTRSADVLDGGITSTAGEGSGTNRFLSGAKAGSVEASFSQGDSKKSATDLRTNAITIMDQLAKNAKSKACALGFWLPYFQDGGQDCEVYETPIFRT